MTAQAAIAKLVCRLRHLLQQQDAPETAGAGGVEHTSGPTFAYIRGLEAERQRARQTAREASLRYNELRVAYTSLQRRQAANSSSTSSKLGKSSSAAGLRARPKTATPSSRKLSHSQSLDMLQQLRML